MQIRCIGSANYSSLTATAVLMVVLFGVPVAMAGQGETTRVSVDSDGTGGDEDSLSPAISADGRYVTFRSSATNLVDGDNNNASDVFVHDRNTGETTRLSVDSDGDEGDSNSLSPAISADGRYVTFRSSATNLVDGDNNNAYDVFVHDRNTGETTRLSVDSDGDEGDSNSLSPAISADGRYITFYSFAMNLVDGDGNDTFDVFIHDRNSGETTRVSVDSDGDEGDSGSFGPAISADGRYVTFHSSASNLVDGDNNNRTDVFVHDRNTGETTRVSVDSDGDEGDNTSLSPAISADGRYVAVRSDASNLVEGDTNNASDVFVHDRNTGETTRVSVDSDGVEGDSDSDSLAISADGRYVTFASFASNLVVDDDNNAYDVFVHDRNTGETTRVSVDSDGVGGDEDAFSPAISADGRYVAFASFASNLVEGATNNVSDVFVHQFLPDPPPPPPPPPPGDFFTDDDGTTFENDINKIAAADITRGCNPPTNDRFCPDDPVTRGQMAAFLVRAFGYTDDGGGNLFTDDDGSTFERDNDRLGAAGVTRGCNPPTNDRFCPDDPVTRGQMAAFLVRAFGYTDDGGGNLFTDDDGSTFERDNDRLGAAGVTRGCNPPTNDRFCPDDPVTRGQMAAFLARAFNLP